MASVSISRPLELMDYSFVKLAMGKLVGNFSQERLIVGLLTTQGIETDATLFEAKLCSNKTMRPVAIHREGSSQERSLSFVAGASQEDNLALRFGLQVERPILGKGTSCRSRFDACCGATPAGGDELGGLRLQCVARGKGEPRPDFGLPPAIEVFDRGLRGGVKTGTTPKERQTRVTRPSVSG